MSQPRVRAGLQRLLISLAVVAMPAGATTAPGSVGSAQVVLQTIEVNAASEAELDSVRGIGPDLNARIRAQRDRRPFASWADFIGRVKPMGPARARQLSDAGLRVAGQPLGAP